MYRHTRGSVYQTAAIAGALAPGGFALISLIATGLELGNSLAKSIAGGFAYAMLACAAFGPVTVPIALAFSAAALQARSHSSIGFLRLSGLLVGLLLAFGIHKVTAGLGLPLEKFLLPLLIPYCGAFCLGASIYITSESSLNAQKAA